MMRDNYLDMNKIITDSKILFLFDTVESHGGVLRFVGGAVRDTLAGVPSQFFAAGDARTRSPGALAGAGAAGAAGAAAPALGSAGAAPPKSAA